MAKSESTLNHQLKKVNKELRNLGLDEIEQSNKEERALVSAAFDAEGVGIINSLSPLIIAVTTALASLIIGNNASGWAIIGATLLLLVGFALSWGIPLLVFDSRQIAVALTNIVNYRANRPQ